MIKIEFDSRKIARDLGITAQAVIKRSVTSALNRAITTGQKLIAQDIASEYTLKSSYIKRAMIIRRAKGNSYTAALIVRDSRLYYSDRQTSSKPVFKAGQTKRAGTYISQKKGSREPLRHAFIATMPTGFRAVFERIPGSQSSKYPKRKREKIRGFMGSSVALIVREKGLRDKAERAMRDMYIQRLKHELKFRSQTK